MKLKIFSVFLLLSFITNLNGVIRLKKNKKILGRVYREKLDEPIEFKNEAVKSIKRSPNQKQSQRAESNQKKFKNASAKPNKNLGQKIKRSPQRGDSSVVVPLEEPIQGSFIDPRVGQYQARLSRVKRFYAKRNSRANKVYPGVNI